MAGAADVVLLATWSRAPLLALADTRRAAPHQPRHRRSRQTELAADLLDAALLVPDDPEPAAHTGALAAPGLARTAAADATLTDVLRGTPPGRTSPGQRTVYAPVGLPCQDLALARHALRQAERRGVEAAVDLPGRTARFRSAPAPAGPAPRGYPDRHPPRRSPEVTEAVSRPTLEAVAARAGVSRATVSRVVNGGDGVREPLAERVRRAVEELGYVPNQAARSLVTRRHDAVAVVIAEPETKVFADPFFALQLRGISKELTAHDNQLVLLLTEGRADHVRVARYLAGGHVDGALVFSLHLDDPLPGLIQDAGVPTVFGGRPGWGEDAPAADPGVAYVDCDNRGGARAAVRHLLDLGRRCIAHITGPLDQTSAADRLDGYRDVMADVLGESDPRLVVESDFTPAGGERAMRELLDRCPDVDAVFAANDLTALGALRVLRESGRRVPEDVAVVGFDDMVPVTEQAEPPLTTVRQDIEEMGRLMARLLLQGLSDGRHRPRTLPGAPAVPDSPGTAVILPTTLIRRASA